MVISDPLPRPLDLLVEALDKATVTTVLVSLTTTALDRRTTTALDRRTTAWDEEVVALALTTAWATTTALEVDLETRVGAGSTPTDLVAWEDLQVDSEHQVEGLTQTDLVVWADLQVDLEHLTEVSERSLAWEDLQVDSAPHRLEASAPRHLEALAPSQVWEVPRAASVLPVEASERSLAWDPQVDSAHRLEALAPSLAWALQVHLEQQVEGSVPSLAWEDRLVGSARRRAVDSERSLAWEDRLVGSARLVEASEQSLAWEDLQEDLDHRPAEASAQNQAWEAWEDLQVDSAPRHLEALVPSLVWEVPRAVSDHQVEASERSLAWADLLHHLEAQTPIRRLVASQAWEAHLRRLVALTPIRGSVVGAQVAEVSEARRLPILRSAASQALPTQALAPPLVRRLVAEPRVVEVLEARRPQIRPLVANRALAILALVHPQIPRHLAAEQPQAMEVSEAHRAPIRRSVASQVREARLRHLVGRTRIHRLVAIQEQALLPALDRVVEVLDLLAALVRAPVLHLEVRQEAHRALLDLRVALRPQAHLLDQDRVLVV